MKLQDKKVSVVMATYNTPTEYLTKSIDSMINQTYKNIEIIVICDGSKEEYEFLKKYYRNTCKVKTYLNNENEGLPYSLNKGIEIATGDYIARMDSDDISLKNRIEMQVDFMEKNKDIAITGMFARFFGDKNKSNKLFFYKPDEIEIQMLYMSCLIHPSVMIRKKFIDENNIRYNTSFLCAQDFELWSRVSNNNNIAIIPKIGLRYRIHNKQISNEKAEIQKKFSKEIIKNNSKKISTDNEIEKCLLVLSGRENITLDNYVDVSKYIDKFLENNTRFKEETLEKILYNRYFHMMIAKKILTLKTINILKNKHIRKKILKMYNVRYVIYLIKNNF